MHINTLPVLTRKTYDVSLVIGVDVLSNNPKSAVNDGGLGQHIPKQGKSPYRTVVIRTSALSGSLRRSPKSLKNVWRCDSKPSTMFSRTV